ncbi:bacterial regulatory helix-turn-helix, lysR family protein, partial [Vibrio parahaemolyticus EKP-026]
FRNKT